MSAKTTLIIALAAVLGSAAMSFPAQAFISADCPYEDNTGGFGGQSGNCAWTCEGPGFGYLDVDAVDPDASVHGEGECLDATLLCESDTDHCSDERAISDVAAGAGTCSGASAEAIDSGLKVSCWYEKKPREPGGHDDELCIVPELVCIPRPPTDGVEDLINPPPLPGDDCGPAPQLFCFVPIGTPDECTDLGGIACVEYPLDQRRSCAVPSWCELAPNSANLFMYGDEALGIICGTDVCWTTEPVCQLSDRIRECRI